VAPGGSLRSYFRGKPTSAHEAQRGITHEGEANFAAFLVCSRENATPYLRYAAYLFATQYLLGEASEYLPREKVEAAWNRLGSGPLADVEAMRDFWEHIAAW